MRRPTRPHLTRYNSTDYKITNTRVLQKQAYFENKRFNSTNWKQLL